MVDSGQKRRQRREPVVSPVLRPVLWSALLGAAVTAALSTPAYAAPLPNTIPDTGSRPVAAGGLRLPGAGAPTVAPGGPVANLGTGPLAIQISTAQTQVALLGERLLQLRQTHTDALTQLATADRDLKAARDTLATAQVAADQAAAEALKAAAALPPGEFGSDLHGLSVLERISKGTESSGDTGAAAREVTRARSAEQLAYQAYLAAETRSRTAATDFAVAEKTYREQEAKLLKLRRDNADQLAAIERQQEAAEQRLGAAYGNGESIAGMTAHPRAQAAVRYALAQLGDPYLWAAEGPDRFDCSGLMWAAYRSKGADYRSLPRVAKDQYFATRGRSVDRSALLPGDLVFFASGSSWTSVHHVGMYIGGGKMVHAPTTGDVVKISNVRWSGFYAATRIFGPVPAPAPKPPATPNPPASPKPPTTPPPASPKPPSVPPKPPTPAPPKPTTPPPTTPAPTPAPTRTEAPTSAPTTTISAPPSGGSAEPEPSTTGTPTS